MKCSSRSRRRHLGMRGRDAEDAADSVSDRRHWTVMGDTCVAAASTTSSSSARVAKQRRRGWGHARETGWLRLLLLLLLLVVMRRCRLRWSCCGCCCCCWRGQSLLFALIRRLISNDSAAKWETTQMKILFSEYIISWSDYITAQQPIQTLRQLAILINGKKGRMFEWMNEWRIHYRRKEHTDIKIDRFEDRHTGTHRQTDIRLNCGWQDSSVDEKALGTLFVRATPNSLTVSNC